MRGLTELQEIEPPIGAYISDLDVPRDEEGELRGHDDAIEYLTSRTCSLDCRGDQTQMSQVIHVLLH